MMTEVLTYVTNTVFNLHQNVLAIVATILYLIIEPALVSNTYSWINFIIVALYMYY